MRVQCICITGCENVYKSKSEMSLKITVPRHERLSAMRAEPSSDFFLRERVRNVQRGASRLSTQKSKQITRAQTNNRAMIELLQPRRRSSVNGFSHRSSSYRQSHPANRSTPTTLLQIRVIHTIDTTMGANIAGEQGGKGERS